MKGVRAVIIWLAVKQVTQARGSYDMGCECGRRVISEKEEKDCKKSAEMEDPQEHLNH